jgi:hypothetical protein
MEAISARERAKQSDPEAENIIPQSSDVGPPFCKPSWKLLATPSQDDSSVTDMPRMESEAKFLYRGVSTVKIHPAHGALPVIPSTPGLLPCGS